MKKCKYTDITRNQFLIIIGFLITIMGAFIYGVSGEQKVPKDTGNYKTVVAPTETEEEPKAGSLEEIVRDPNNSVYPYNTMSADWGSEIYKAGFVYYQIPPEYEEAGGCFPEVVQAYLWSICKERDIDYYIAVSLIERESGYKWDRTGDDGNSKGYMQVYEKWHCDRMEAEGVSDLYNPYQNIRVGLSYLKEIQDEYLDSSGISCVLMVYNMGETTAKRVWSKGVYSTEYSREIISRAQEIKQELQD